MNSDKDGKKADDTPREEDEKQLFKLYGKLPSKRDLLGNQAKDRKYFDSGDFALSKAGITSDTGVTLRTGKAHPLTESISTLSSPVPSQSNVAKDADRSRRASTNLSPTEGSHLSQHEDADVKPAEVREG